MRQKSASVVIAVVTVVLVAGLVVFGVIRSTGRHEHMPGHEENEDGIRHEVEEHHEHAPEDA